ncbi:MAG: YtxH domain-containing protein [Bacteroidetes bacterium]|nr:YtxH domain-containing protein [Bacteroidota bacterium]
MSNTGKIVTAAVAGVAAGAILGILFAPDKGSETRKKINEQGKKFAGSVKDGFLKGKEKFNAMKDEFEDALNEKAGQLV